MANLVSYTGALTNYAVIGFAVFVAPAVAPSLSQGDADARAMAISNVSFVLLMLASGFSQIVNVSKQVADVAGYFLRFVPHCVLTVMSKAHHVCRSC